MIDIAKALIYFDAEAKEKRDRFIEELKDSLNRHLPMHRLEIIEYEYRPKEDENSLTKIWGGSSITGWKVVFVDMKGKRVTLNPNGTPFGSEEEAQTFVDNYQSMLRLTTNQPPCNVFVRGYCPEENE